MDNLHGHGLIKEDEEDGQSKSTDAAAATTVLITESIELMERTTDEPDTEPTTDEPDTEPTTDEPDTEPINPPSSDPHSGNKTETEASEDLSESLKSQEIDNDNENDNDDEEPPPKKQKHLSSLTNQPSSDQNHTPIAQPIFNGIALPAPTAPNSKKSKKKNNNVWATKSTRKGKKKSKATNNNHSAPVDDTVLITPVARFPDKTDDTPDMTICLSKVYKAEKVEVSEDRMSAGSTKGYRMVRATRGVVEGAWYFEIKVVNLGASGHTRLGWSTEKGDLQAPVGYDGNSFGYRDIDGSKVHKALRDRYGEEGYKEGDVIGFYINLPDGGSYAPKPPHLVWYKGQRYACAPDVKEDPPKVVPGSEISFFKNGVCQGVAFKDLYGGRYYPAASMYTLPHQQNCVVKFNFGPEFEFFPEDFDGRPVPQPMVKVPYHGFENRVENGVADEKKQ